MTRLPPRCLFCRCFASPITKEALFHLFSFLLAIKCVSLPFSFSRWQGVLPPDDRNPSLFPAKGCHLNRDLRSLVHEGPHFRNLSFHPPFGKCPQVSFSFFSLSAPVRKSSPTLILLPPFENRTRPPPLLVPEALSLPSFIVVPGSTRNFFSFLIGKMPYLASPAQKDVPFSSKTPI